MSNDSPRLYLMLPPATRAAGLADLLLPALQAGDVACLLLQTETMGEEAARKLIDICKPLCARSDTALLVGDPHLAKAVGCDGAHLPGRADDSEKALATAIRLLKPGLICGAGGLRSKHAAMAAGELDIDYVMFGDPAPDGYAPPLEQTSERTAWWADIFNVPCVAYAAGLEDVATLATAGADFIALREAVWNDPRGPAAAIAVAMAHIADAPVRTGANPT